MLNQLADKIEPHLLENEKILWLGQPKQGFFLRSSDFIMIPFSIFFVAGPTFTMVTLYQESVPFAFKIFIVPFFLVGLYLFVGRFWVDIQKRKQTFYAITGNRILIVQNTKKQQVFSVNIAAETHFEFYQTKNGFGTINIGDQSNYFFRSSGNSLLGTQMNSSPAFEAIPEVKKVFQLLMYIKRGENPSPILEGLTQ
ncbi:MAG: hypothetical protein IT244_08245 [Bacteroidia bacterium]|nr:hypothetical protein [Bacteroidia bacterium]